jgi:hypothetical protein
LSETSFKFDAGLEKLKTALNPARYRQRLNENVGRAVQLNAKIVEKKMRGVITAGLQPGQSELQEWLKGSSKPGVDHQDLFKAITSRKIKMMTYFVGVMRTAKKFNVAEIIHFGSEIKVTKKMRGLFHTLWLVDQGRLSASKLTGRAKELYSRRKGKWKPLSPGTSKIVIPGRPFVTLAMADTAMKAKIAKNFAKAAQFSFTGGKKR